MDIEAQKIGIMDTVNKYFDGLYRSNTQLLREIFHPKATITGYGGDGTLRIMTLDDFLEFVDTVPSPANDGIEFDMAVLSIDQSGKAAAVKVRDYYLKRDFIDYLHLAKTTDGWKITAKAFHSDPRA